MIIVKATMWPGGDAFHSYELLHATIRNISGADPVPSHEYFAAHVLSRPNRFFGIEGFEADLQVNGHRRTDGISPLLMAVLGAANYAGKSPGSVGTVLPASRVLARAVLTDATEFEQALKAHTP